MRHTNLLALSCCAAARARRCGLRQQRQQPARRLEQRLERPAAPPRPAARINGAGATFPAPVYQEWAARFKEDAGHDRQLPGASAPAAASRSSRAGTVDFGATDSAMKDEEIAAAKKQGRPGPRPDGARRGDRLLQRRRRRQGPQARRRDDRRHLPRQDHEVERPEDRRARTRGAQLPSTNITRLPPLRRVGHDEELHAVPRRLLAGVEERPRRRQVGQVADRHRRQGQRRRRRLRQADRRARSATSSRPTRCRTTSRPPRSRTSRATYVEPSLRGDVGRRRRASTPPEDLRFSTINAPGDPGAYPITAVTFLLVYAGRLQGRA